MTTATYYVKIDWDDDDSYEDMTSYVLDSSLSWQRGKQFELDQATPGTCQFKLRNEDGTFSPDNSGSAYYGNLKLYRKVQVSIYDPTTTDTTVVFTGFIQRMAPSPRWDQNYVYVLCYDGLDYMARTEVRTSLEKDIGTGACITKILDAASWDAGLRDIDTGQDTVPYAYWHKVKARTGLTDVEKSEVGFIYVNGSGELVFEDRHHRMKPPHTTSQHHFNETASDCHAIWSPDLIYNEVRSTITPWDLGSLAVFWTLQQTGADSPLIRAGESLTVWADADYFLDSVTNPAETTDYLMNTASDGSGSNVSSDFTVTPTVFAQTCKLVIANGGAVDAYVTFLQVRGTEYAPQEGTTIVETDSTSQDDYGLRTLALDAKLMDDVVDAISYSQYLISRYKQPQPNIELVAYNRDSDHLTALITMELSDRVTVTNSVLGLSAAPYYINAMEHHVKMGKVHEVKYTLSAVGDEGEFWCLGTSTLGDATGETTRLGY